MSFNDISHEYTWRFRRCSHEIVTYEINTMIGIDENRIKITYKWDWNAIIRFLYTVF